MLRLAEHGLMQTRLTDPCPGSHLSTSFAPKAATNAASSNRALAPDRFLLPQIGNNQPRPNRAHGTSEIEGKVARVATSKLGDERVSNPGVIFGRCLQCDLLAMALMG